MVEPYILPETGVPEFGVKSESTSPSLRTMESKLRMIPLNFLKAIKMWMRQCKQGEKRNLLVMMAIALI